MRYQPFLKSQISRPINEWADLSLPLLRWWAPDVGMVFINENIYHKINEIVWEDSTAVANTGKSLPFWLNKN